MMNTKINIETTTQDLNWEMPVLYVESWEDTESLGGFFRMSP